MENQQARFDHLATQMDKMLSLGRMAAGIAHEINNPLAGILLYSSNMSKKVPQGGRLEEGLNIIIKETQRCKTIIQGLLEFARDREPQKVPADINAIMETALGILDNEFRLRHVDLELQLSENMVKTLLDENQIEQVFINLLLNAIHAVEENGRVTIQTAVDSETNKIRVEITDNGCGIAADDIKKIFEPFYSTKTKGTGLGLAVSYGIVKNHQGDIRVYSVLRQGTRFTLDFPIRAENSSERGDHENAQHPGH
jgi:signal transduction histidine kinase